MRLIPVEDYVAFDLETTGLSPQTDEILEVAMVRFRAGESVERWSSLVNPEKPVPLKTLRLTGIDPGDLLTGPALGELIPIMEEFRGRLPLVGHNSGFDASFLAKRIAGFPGVPLYDTLELARIAVPGFKSYRLVDLAREMGVVVSEAHRAYDDAEVSGVLFRLLQQTIGTIPQEIRLAVRQVMGEGWPSGRIFVGPFTPLAPRDLAQSSAQPQLPLAEEASQADAAARSTSIEPVPPKVPLSCGDEALRGVVGALLTTGAKEEGDRVIAVNLPLDHASAAAVISAVQGYAAEEGKAILLVGFPDDAIPSDLVRAGRPRDFLCRARLAEAVAQAEAGAYAGIDLEKRQFMAGLFRWAAVTRDGSFAGLQMGSVGHQVVSEVSCSPSMECADSCPKASSCFYLQNQARTKSPSPGQGVIAFAPAYSSVGLVDAYDQVLVWASHDLGRVWQMQEPRVHLTRLQDALNGFAQMGAAVSTPSLSLFDARAHEDLRRGGHATPETLILAARVATELSLVSSRVRSEREELLEGGAYKVDPPMLWEDLSLVESCIRDLLVFASGDGQGAVSIVEQDYRAEGGRGVVLVRRAIWPAAAAVASLRKVTRDRLVLLSDIHAHAVASDGGKRSLGLGSLARCHRAVPGPSMDKVLLGVLDAGRGIGPKAYAEYLAGLLVQLCPVVRKGVLATFPSRALLKETYSLVQPLLEEQGIAVYGQGIDGGYRVVEHLEEDETVVLALAGSGPISGDPVPGCLVLTRVPFAPPNPLDEVRRAEISSSGGDGFIEVSLRPGAIALRAHVERMGRSGKPCAVILADPRLVPGRSAWGGAFMASFDDLARVVCPARDLVSRVLRHLTV